jgi:fluoride ion exporter CrcB/FEX
MNTSDTASTPIKKKCVWRNRFAIATLIVVVIGVIILGFIALSSRDDKKIDGIFTAFYMIMTIAAIGGLSTIGIIATFIAWSAC